MNGDTFVKNISPKALTEDENNFFMQSDILRVHKSKPESNRHLNDYDANLLKEDAYKEINDETFKLECKITKTENEINEIKKQIEAAKVIRDSELVSKLMVRQQQLNNELQQTVSEYEKRSLSAMISGGLTSGVRNYVDKLKNKLKNFSYSVAHKLPTKIVSFMQIKSSLVKLENINKSVDELMMLQTPYGEAIDRYEQLSKYITKANSIQSEISKYLK